MHLKAKAFLTSMLLLASCVSVEKHASVQRGPSNDGTVSQPGSKLFPNSVKFTWADKEQCSGYAIDPVTIVTAAHCFKETQKLNRAMGKLKIFVGGVPADGQYRVFATRTFDFHAERASDTSGDLALVVFSKPVATAPFVKVGLGPDQTLSENDAFASIGYGPSPHEAEASLGSGIAREASLKLIPQTEASKLSTQLGPDGAGAVCGGDSGSPLFNVRDGETYLVGVLSSTRAIAAESDLQWQESLSPADLQLPENQSRLCRIGTGQSFWTKIQDFTEFFAEPAANGRLIYAGE